MNSTETFDVQCQVCGATYSLYFARPDAGERHAAVEMVRQALSRHHASVADHSAHPEKAFNVPEWNGPANASAAALLGGAPAFAS